MTKRTDPIAECAQHSIVGLFDFVVLMASNASCEAEILKRLGVRTLCKQFVLLPVTLAAHARYRIQTRRARPMVAVTIVTCGCTEIVAVDQCNGMDALSVLLKLVRGNLI